MIDPGVSCVHRLQPNLTSPVTCLPVALPWTFLYIPIPTPTALLAHPACVSCQLLPRSNPSPVMCAGSQELHTTKREEMLPDANPGGESPENVLGRHEEAGKTWVLTSDTYGG